MVVAESKRSHVIEVQKTKSLSQQFLFQNPSGIKSANKAKSDHVS
jgi:hypothetical protein